MVLGALSAFAGASGANREFTPSGVVVNGRLTGKVERKDFPDGYAVRYILPKGERRITDEKSVWTLPGDARLWYQTDADYESPYRNSLVKDVPKGTRLCLPMTAKLPDGTYRLITEANLVNYTDAEVVAIGDNSFKVRYHADPDGFTQTGEAVTPWRVTIVARNINELVKSDMVRRLCPPPPPERAARAAEFAKPGRAVWQWLPAGAPRLEDQRDWIDKTAKLGFEYYLIDEGWRNWSADGKDRWACLKETIDYATSKGVKCAIWVHSNEIPDRARRLDYLKRTKEAGAVGIKIDFMPPCNYHWCNWYEETLEDTFEAGLFVDFHGAVKPTGRERTWPHELAREAVRGHEWHITRYHRVLPYDHDTILPFCRLVQGHADYTPLVFQKEQLIHFTWARQLAQAVVFSAPFLCTGDFPKNYLDNPAQDFIKHIPAVYDESHLLPGSEIGEVVGFMKRKGGTWYIAIENGETPREFTIDLRLLPKGKTLSLTGYCDNPDRLDAYRTMARKVKRSDKLTIPLRKGGGFAAIIEEDHIFSPDPAPVVDGDTLWVFTGHDMPRSDWFHMPDWQVFSTKDMENWTQHGVVMDTSVFKWAKQGDRAWASQAIKRDGNWYWYVAVLGEHGGDFIGVATAKSPLGPWTDPIGKPLCGPGNAWIDPTVMVDDDGRAWLFWGNAGGDPGCWYVELKRNMVEKAGEIKPVPGLLDEQCFGPTLTGRDGRKRTNFVEAPWIYKRGKTYYLEYAAGGVPEHWAYSTSDSIHGPWRYRGKITDLSPRSFTIHGGSVHFKGRDYLFLHDGTLPGGGGFCRSACFQEFKYNPDGTIPFQPLKVRHIQ